MKYFFLVLLYFFSFILPISAQVSNIKYGRIDPSDLAMTQYPQDTQATAVILSKIGWIHFDPTQEDHAVNAENHVVIKILKEEGIEEVGNAFIHYNTFRNYSRLGSLRAQVHLPDGTVVKLDKSHMFDEKTNRYVSTKKIAFPRLVVGAIIEYEYNIIFSNLYQPVDWYFQDDIPIRYAELKTYLPEWLEYVVLTQGSKLEEQHHEVIFEKRYNTKFIHSTFFNHYVPALKTECCITTMRDYFTRVRYQLKAIALPFRMRQDVMNTWEKLAEELYDLEDWGGQLTTKQPGQLVLEAAGMTTGTITPGLQTAKTIYDYINQHIQWDKTYDFGGSTSIKEILNLKSGSSGEMNKMLCAALMQAGIPAKPVLVSTRDHGKMIQLYPFTSQFNHMLVLATIDQKAVWLDASQKKLPFGQLPENVLNAHGWVVDQQSPHWVDIIPPLSKSVFLIKGSIDAAGNLNGELECRFTGYHAMEKRAMLEKQPMSLVANGSIALPVADIEIVNADAIAQPLLVKARIVDQPVATITDEHMFINGLFPVGMDDLPFKLEERTYPIEMNYPAEISMILNVSLPEGYRLESDPEPIRFSTENAGIQVIHEASEIANKLNVNIKFSISQLEFPPEEYQALKNIYVKRKEKFTEQISLRKI